jgi:DNA polymerase III subunit epsilon
MSVAPPVAPDRKLRKRSWRAVELAALDFEATGLDLKLDAIISFGVVPIRNGAVEVGESVYELVDPGDVVPSRASIVVHGLRPVDLVGAPSVATARSLLGACLAGKFLVTWWAPVEAAFLDKLFGGGQKSWLKRILDVRDLLIALEGDGVADLTLTAAAERFGVPVAAPHHALDDALVTAQLFLVTATKLAGRGASVRDLVRAGRR